MEICRKEAFKLVGIRVEADWRGLGTEMPAAWQALRARQEEIAHRVDDDILDVCLYEGGGIFIQCVGVEVSRLDAIPEGMIGVDIPAQQYIYHLHRGSEDQIASTFGDMYAWANRNGIAADAFRIDRTSSNSQTERFLFIRAFERET